jgi:hypothetical protein
MDELIIFLRLSSFDSLILYDIKKGLVFLIHNIKDTFIQRCIVYKIVIQFYLFDHFNIIHTQLSLAFIRIKLNIAKFVIFDSYKSILVSD